MMPFDPSQTQIRFGWEPAVGRRPTTWHDFPVESEDLAAETDPLQRNAITRLGQRQVPLTGKRDTGGSFVLDAFEPSAHGYLLAPLLKKGSVTNPGGGNVRAWKLALSETLITFPETFSILVDRDDGTPQRLSECRMSSLALNFAERQLSGATFSLVAARGDYWDEAVELAATATPPAPEVRGVAINNFSDSTDDDLEVKVSGFSAGVSVTVLVKLRGDTYGATAVVVPFDTWTTISFSDASGIVGGTLPDGTRNPDPVQIYFEDDTYDVNDEWRFGRVIPSWTASPPTPNPVNEIYGRVLVDTVETEIDSGTFTLTKTSVEAKHGYGGREARRTRERGFLESSFTVEREVADKVFRQKLELGQSLALVVELLSGVPIEAGARDFGLTLKSPKCLLGGRTAVVAGSEEYNDALTMTAHPDATASPDVDSVQAYLDNDVAAIQT